MPEWIRVFWLPSKSIDNLKELPQDAGVYYITALWVVLYVGKAKNLRNRWRTNHHRYQQFKLLQPFGRLHYQVVSLKQLDQYEKAEIAKFNPKWNGTSRPSFWNLLGLFLAVWGRVIVYASLLMLAIAVFVYSVLK